MYYLTNYFSDCANNFPNRQHRPHNGDPLRLEIRKSDIFLGVTGVAFVFSEDLYAGWIIERQKMPLLERLQGGEKLEGSAEGVKHFWWKYGSDNCAESILCF